MGGREKKKGEKWMKGEALAEKGDGEKKRANKQTNRIKHDYLNKTHVVGQPLGSSQYYSVLVQSEICN
jgi:hypothetical protein